MPGRPQVCAPHILLVLARGDHLVEHVLERTIEGRGLGADMVCWVAWEGLCCEADTATSTVTAQPCVGTESEFESALSCSKGHLSSRDPDMILAPSQAESISADIQVGRRVFHDEMLEVANWVNASIDNFGVLETAIWPHRLDLRPIKITHLFLIL